MQLGYRTGVGKLIWAMTTCRLDLAFASVKLSQSNSCLHKIHYHGLKQALKYLFSSEDNDACVARQMLMETHIQRKG